MDFIANLLALDGRFSTQLQIARNPSPLRTIAIWFAHSGDSWFWLAGLSLLWFFGTPAWKARAFALGSGVLVTAFLVLLIKFSVRRQRPVGEWGNIYRKTDPHSFPSGHSARAFMLVVMSLRLGPAWFAILIAVWAPLVGLARIAMGVHYLLDVMAGMVIGIIMGGIMLWILPM